MVHSRKMLTYSKANFVALLGGGIQGEMALCYLADEIAAGGDDEEASEGEKYVKKHLLHEAKNAVGDIRHWFSPWTFKDHLDDPKKWSDMVQVLETLANFDIGLFSSLEDSYMDRPDTWSGRILLRRVEEREFVGFKGLWNKPVFTLKRLFRLVKFLVKLYASSRERCSFPSAISFRLAKRELEELDTGANKKKKVYDRLT
jgi:hypothetical protein